MRKTTIAFLLALVALGLLVQRDLRAQVGGVVTILDGLGTLNQAEVTAANALRVDAGAVTVSGTVTANQGTPGATAWPVILTGGTSVFNGQQAVTAIAAALPTNTTKTACVKALVGNALNVFVGASGVTTGTGQELAPGDAACFALDNTNKLFVIASGSGSSVAFHGTN